MNTPVGSASNERRALPRWGVLLKASYEDTNQQKRQALVSNISNKGIKLFLCEDISLDKELMLDINLEADGDISARARVCWKQGSPNGFHAGFSFVCLNDYSKNKIFQYITHCCREQVRNAWFEKK